MPRLPNPLALIETQRGHLFVWVPVFFAVGIVLYFNMPREPFVFECIWLICSGVVCSLLSLKFGELLSPVFCAFSLVIAGFFAAVLQANWVAAPVLDFRYYGPVEGRIVRIDRSHSNRTRYTLDQVVLARVAPDDTPERVRISVHGAQITPMRVPGQNVLLTAHLSPPPRPAEPGGFDFRRFAWFQQLGAVGYTRTPVMLLEPEHQDSPAAWLRSTRYGLSQTVQSWMPGGNGAFATAITTGDRSAIPSEILEDLRATNLAHLLAISGLHMGLLTGFVFGALRFLLAAIPLTALYLPIKKIAAVGALMAATIYLFLSGGNVATQRAFIMVAVMLIAICLDRRAITLQAVAVAALIVLVLQPNSLVSPGFQMSFSATIALVSVFGALRNWDWFGLPKIVKPMGAVVLSSAVAGIATAPVAAAHFNQFSQFGLIANILSVPIMGAIVMPAAVITFLLAPFGLSLIGVFFMELGIDWILWVAQTIAALDGSVRYVVTPQQWALPLFAIGGLFIALWQGKGRWVGAPILMCSAILWVQTQRPVLLISDTADLIGVLRENGRVLNKERGQGFVARSWLENDGVEPIQAVAFDPELDERLIIFDVGSTSITHVRSETDVADTCRVGIWIYAYRGVEMDGDCLQITPETLDRSGSLAFFETENGLTEVSSTEMSGNRLWSPFPHHQ